MPYDRVLPFIDVLRTKKLVEFICQVCQKQDRIQFNKMRRRTICGVKPICRRCALGFATSSDEWRANNSRSQLVAQNQPAVLKKQRAAQKRLMESDPLYVEKRANNFYIAGSIDGIRFDSSWELFYILYCLESADVESIRRFDGYVPYSINGVQKRYYPDFLVSFKNGDKKIVEIKGELTRFAIEKELAAKKLYGVGYKMLRQQDLHALGLFVRREMFLREWYPKAFQHAVQFNRNGAYLRWRDRIEKWLKLSELQLRSIQVESTTLP